MTDTTHKQAVRESRAFYRRNLALRMAVAHARSGQLVDNFLSAQIARSAAEIADRLEEIEEREING